MVDRIVREPEYAEVAPGARTGEVFVPSSKSQLHRLLICAALGERPSEIAFKGLSEDIRATARCLNALGAKIEAEEAETGGPGRLLVTPADRSRPARGAVLDCGESGTTLRFLLPLCGMLGATCLVLRGGRLPERPLDVFAGAVELLGVQGRAIGGMTGGYGFSGVVVALFGGLHPL